jgi:hypothetical protein
MVEIINLPYSVTRRIHARKPRRSKNGTPEERAARTPAAAPTELSVRRRSKNGTPEERATRKTAIQATILSLKNRRAGRRRIALTVATGKPESAA